MRAEFLLDYDVLTVERAQKLYLMARFVGGDAPADHRRRPLNLSLVIDRSGSMAGEKMDYTRQAAQFLVQHLSSQDRFSLVLYNDKVETLVAAELVTNKDRIAQQIQQIRVGGTTNLSGGWLQGCQHVASYASAESLNRVIVMTDGLANRGVTDTNQLVTLARQKYEEGVPTTTMGLGSDFNEDLLVAMANAGGGAFYFIESPEVAPAIFEEELSGLLALVGQNLTITLTPTHLVTSVKQLNAYPMQNDGRRVSFRLGDVFAQDVKQLLLELDIPSLAELGEQQVAVLRFEYDAIEGDTTEHHSHEMPVMVKVAPLGELPVPPDAAVAQSVLLLKAAQARQEAVHAADRGDYDGASRLLRTVAMDIEASPVRTDQLNEERDALLAQAELLAHGAQAYDQYSRKTMYTQSYYTMTSRHTDTMQLRGRERERQSQKMHTQELSPTPNQPPQPQASENENVPYQPNVTPNQVLWRGRAYALVGDIVRIGRSRHNELVIDEKGVSRFHAQIRREPDGWYIEDLGSTNGTTVGGAKLKAPYRVSVGDVVYVCDEKLTFALKA